MLEAGQASVADVDGALESAGYARGPLRTLDEVGLDVDLAIGDALVETWGEERFASPRLQRELVAAGRLGRATGRGFYRYGPDGRAVPDVARPLAAPLAPEHIVERIELAVVNEAYRAVADGLGAPPAIDEVMRAVAGFPLGPFQLVDRIGLRAVIAATPEPARGDRHVHGRPVPRGDPPLADGHRLTAAASAAPCRVPPPRRRPASRRRGPSRAR